jgi:hypothetical protein
MWLLDWGQSCSKLATTPGLRTGVAIARFRIIRARFNKRSTPVFPKEKSSFEYPQCAAPQFGYRRSLLRFLEAAASSNGELSMKKPSLWMIAAVCLIASASVAHARSAYDGSWDLVFVTQRGSCDPSYNFTVNISHGIVTHPNLVKFKGYVAKSGAVHASVTVHEKFASGTGRLFGTSGRGTWSGREGSERCSGYWTAEHN